MRVLFILALCLLAPATWIPKTWAAPVLAIQDMKTPKGIPFWFVQDKTLPLFTLHFSLKGGAQLDQNGKEGTAEMLTTLLDEGAGSRDAEAFQDEMDRSGIKIRFSNGRDYFSGSIKAPTETHETAEALFDDALNRPHLDQEAIERMRQALLSDQRFMNDDPNWIASKALYETLFKGHSYARLPEGNDTTLKAITRADLVTVKSKLFCRTRLKIALMGDLEKEQAVKMIDRLFGVWPVCDETIAPQAATLPTIPQSVAIKREGAQTVLIMAQPGLARQNPDWWAARILDFVLGGGSFSSRLMDEIRVKRGYTYGISTGLMPLQLGPLWLIQAGLDPHHERDAIAEIEKIWADVAKNGITQTELDEAKSFLTGSLPLALTTSDEIAEILLQLQEDDLPTDTLDHRNALINAVTLADVKRVAQKYLQPMNLTRVTVGPQLEQKGKRP